MTKSEFRPSVEQVARFFGAPAANVRACYAVNAKSLRSFAVKARERGGKYRGQTEEYYLAKAEVYQRKANQ